MLLSIKIIYRSKLGIARKWAGTERLSSDLHPIFLVKSAHHSFFGTDNAVYHCREKSSRNGPLDGINELNQKVIKLRGAFKIEGS